MIYPWHETIWQNVVAHWHNQPNAWLMLGKSNTGKTAFARHLAQALLCEAPLPARQPCGICPSCHLFLQGNHPDFYVLEPELPENELSGSRKLLQIKIDAVRTILEPLMQSSVRGGRRVVLLSPAESLNLQAANALLKMLEEPPQAVIFLLLSHNRDRVLPTIKSRCRQLLLPAPAHDQALDYLRGQNVPDAENQLAFHGGAPLFRMDDATQTLRETLLDWLSAPRLLAALDYAARYDQQKLPLAHILNWLQKWLIDVALAAQNHSPLYYPQRAAQVRVIATKMSAVALFTLSGSLNRLIPYAYHSLNVKLQTEDLLCAYLTAVIKKTN